MEKIILCVDAGIQPPLTYNAFYVGMSRIRRSDDIRLVSLNGPER